MIRIKVFTFLIIFILLNILNLDANVIDPTNGRTGAPGELTCGGICHNGNSNGAGVSISFVGNPTYYIPGQTYQMMLTINDPVSSCYGFQMTNFDVGTASQGTFSGNSDVQVQTVSTRDYIEHANGVSANGVWTFNWQAPTMDVGQIDFYACGVAGDCNGNELGDAVYLENVSLLAPPACPLVIDYNSNNNVLAFDCDYSTDEPRWVITINSITGGSGTYAITPFGEGIVSNTSANTGNGFSYSFTSTDQLNGSVGFQIDDGNGAICFIEESVLSQLLLIPGPQFICTSPLSCSNNIEVSFASGDAFDIFSCIPNTDGSLVVNATNISGGSGMYTLSTLGNGILSTANVTTGSSFSYTFTQAEIDAQNGNIGFSATDNSGCTTNYDFSGQTVFESVSDYCAGAACDLTTVLNNSINVNCNGANDGIASVSASSTNMPLNYEWVLDGNILAINSSSANNLSPGNYVVTISDAVCSEQQTFTITEPTALIASNCISTSPSTVGGNDGSIIVSVSGGTPNYNYNWDNGGTTNPLTGVAAGTYNLTVSDANNCTSQTLTCTVIDPELNCDITVSEFITGQISCFGLSDGSINLFSSSTNGNISFQWILNGSTLPITSSLASNLTLGTYTIIGTDDANCSAQVDVTIIEPTPVNVFNCVPISPSVFGGNDGSTSVMTSGGSGTYNYLWSDGQTTNPATGLIAGTYSVTVSDQNSCTAMRSCTVTDLNCDTDISVQSSGNVSCNGGNDGIIIVAATSSNNPINYTWLLNGNDIGATGAIANNLVAGNYEIIATDAIGCTSSTTIAITEPIILSLTNCSPTSPSTVGGSDGMVSITVLGGTPNYNYLWNDGQTTNPAIGLIAGNYSLTVTDGNNCTAQITCTISEPTVICNLSATATFTSPICNGESNGSLIILETGGSAPLTYSLNNGQSNSTGNFNGLPAGNYVYTVMDINNCTFTENVTISEPLALMVFNCNAVSPTTIGGSNGSISVSVSGGTPNYNYLWSGGQTTNPSINLTVGTYSLTVTDANNCTSQLSCSVTDPNINCDLDATTFVSEPTCNAGSNGTITVLETGGTAPYTYTLNNNQSNTNGIFSGLTAGTYNYNITDANNCTFSEIAVIAEPTAVIVSNCNPISPSIIGGSDGLVSVTVSGGTGSYTYFWSNGQTTNPALNLSTGVYNVTVNDALNCSSTLECTVLDAICNVSASASITTNVNCIGENNAALTISQIGTGTPPFVYTLSNGNFNSNGVFNNLGAGNYSYTVVDASNCSFTDMIAVMEPTELVVSNCNPISPNVVGGNDGTISVTATGGTGSYTYLWSDGQTTNPAINLIAGSYQVTVFDANNCSQNLTCILEDPVNNGCNLNIDYELDGFSIASDCDYSSDVPRISIQINSVIGGGGIYEVTPFGDGIVSNTLVNSGNGFTYSYTSNDVNNGTIGFEISDCNGNICFLDDNIQNGLLASLPSAFCTAALNCNEQIEATIALGNAFDIYSCEGFASNSLIVNVDNVTGSNGFYSISTLGTGVLSSSAVNTGQSFNYVFNQSDIDSQTGFIGFVLTGNNGCSTEYDFSGPTLCTNISDFCSASCDLSLSINNTTNVSCEGLSDGSINLIATSSNGTINYVWTLNNNVINITNSFANNLAIGNYVVTATDGLNCQESINITISEPNIELNCSSINANINNNNGSVSIAISGGATPYDIIWDTGATTATVSNLAAGDYAVMVTDNNGCNAQTICTVENEIVNCNLAVSMTNVQNITCFNESDGSAIANVTNSFGNVNYVLSLNNNVVNSFATSSLVNLAPGLYTIEATDANNCADATQFIIAEPSSLQLNCSSTTNTSSVIPNGSVSILATGGTTPFTYLWNTGDNTPNVNNLFGGSYSVTVADANNCVETAVCVVPIDECDLTLVVDNYSENICAGTNDGFISIQGNSSNMPINYNWFLNGNSTTINGSVESNLVPGTYTIEAVDNNNCTESLSLTITGTTPISIIDCIATTPTNNLSNNGTLQVVTSGGELPFSYLWSNGATTESLNNLAPGDYSVVITDASNCSSTTNCLVAEPINCDITISLSNISQIDCFGNISGSIAVNVLSSYMPINYNWSIGGQPTFYNSASESNLGAGIYDIMVIDSIGCVAMLNNLIINEPPLLSSNGCTSTDPTGLSNNDGSTFVTVVGGVSPYSYNWSNGSTGSSIDNLTPGSYSVTITDSYGCSITETCIINPFVVNCNLDINVLEVVNLDCGIPNSGSIALIASSQFLPINYQWSLDGINLNYPSSFNANLAAGTYVVNAMDVAGCTGQIIVDVTEQLPIEIISCVAVAPTFANGNDGNSEIVFSGGTAPFMFAWSNGQSTNPAVNLNSGIHNYTITDVNGCTFSGSCQVPAFSNNCSLGLAANANSPSCFNGNDGVININTNNPNNLTFVWSPNVSSAAVAINLSASTYVIDVSDANGCTEQIAVSLLNPTELNIDVVSGYDCNGPSNTYSITVNVSGGTGNGQVVTDNGIVDSSNYPTVEITNIPDGEVANVYVTDANNCNSDIIPVGPFNCDEICVSTIGDLFVNEDVCVGQNIVATANNFTIANYQQLYLVYHNSPNYANSFPTNIYQTDVNTNNFTSNLLNNGNLPSQVYVTAVISNSQPFSALDLEANCTIISNTFAINLIGNLTANLSAPYTCNTSYTAYSTQFQIDGSIGNLNITSNVGTINYISGNSYEISNIPINSIATVSIIESNCGTETLNIGPFNCSFNCTGQVGTTAVDNASICPNGSANISSNGFVTGANQNVFIVLHNSSNFSNNLPSDVYAVLTNANNFGNTIINNGNWQNTIYATAIAATSDGSNGYDLNDPCLLIANTIEITMLEEFTVNAASNFVCASNGLTYSASISINVSNGNYSLNASSGIVNNLGSGNFTISGIPTGSTSTVSLVDNNGCLNNVVNVGPYDCNTSSSCNSNVGSFSVSNTSICDGTNVVATANSFGLSAVQQLFIVYHNSSNPLLISPTQIYQSIATNGNSNTATLGFNNALPNTIYVTAIVASTLNSGEINFADDCIVASETIAITVGSNIAVSTFDYNCSSGLSYNAAFSLSSNASNYVINSSLGNAVINSSGQYEIVNIPNGQTSFVSVQSNNGCTTSFVVGPFNCTNTTVNLISLEDPCDCNDSNNYSIGSDFYLYETITVSGAANLNLSINANNINGMYDSQGNLYNSNLQLIEVASGIYIFNFWHLENVGYNTIVSDGSTNLDISNVCSNCSVVVTPTNCFANAGNIIPPTETIFCANSGTTINPTVINNNTSYGYTYYLTDVSGTVVMTSSNGIFSTNILSTGTYYVNGISFDPSISQSLNVANINQLINQNLCLDISQNAYTITIEDCGLGQNCSADAGILQALIGNSNYCENNLSQIMLPTVVGNNSSFDYLFIVTNSNGNIVAATDGGLNNEVNLQGNSAGTYCIHGLSYDANAFDTPNLSISTLANLVGQTNTCFDLTTSCNSIIVQAATVNNGVSFGPTDTTVYCTQYVTPIDICFNINDPNNQGVKIVDIISNCNPTIESENCINYPPLPGLEIGMTELISVIFCDDQCPQLCDTTYAIISIEEECEEIPVVNCDDFYFACAEPLTSIEVCFDCQFQNNSNLIINDIDALFSNCTIDQTNTTCIEYTALPGIDEVGMDTIEVTLCDQQTNICNVIPVYMTFENCDNEGFVSLPSTCDNTYFGCTAPITPFTFCLNCESNLNPNIAITHVNSLFNCGTNIVSEFCMEYTPLPGMEIVGVDTVEIIYCDDNSGNCEIAFLMMTFDDCGDLIIGELNPNANDDELETEMDESVSYNLLMNDDAAIKQLVTFNIVGNPANGVAIVTGNLNVVYQPNDNFVGTDKLTYQICAGNNCDEAEAIIKVGENKLSLENDLVSIYPNPTKNFVNVNFAEEFNQLNILNALGSIVKTKVISEFEEEMQIDISDLPNGFYLFEFTKPYKTIYKKVIKE